MRAIDLVAMLGCALAQTPQFDAASVKLAGGQRGQRFRIMPGGGIVAQAWAVEDYEISGGPAWTGTLRFEIAAKSEKNLTEAETLESMQVLPADRFRLMIRHETLETPVYHLVMARKDGRLGRSWWNRRTARAIAESCKRAGMD